MTNEVKLDVKEKAPKKRKIASLDKRKSIMYNNFRILIGNNPC